MEYGEKNVCKGCGEEIVWTGKYWEHVGNIAEPKFKVCSICNGSGLDFTKGQVGLCRCDNGKICL